MTIEQRTSKDVTILDVRGKMTIEVLGDLAIAEKARALSQAGHKRILLNLEGVSYLDTMGLCNIIEAYITVQRQHGTLKLLRPSSHVRHLLTITRLITVLDVYDAEADAVASFGVAAST